MTKKIFRVEIMAEEDGAPLDELMGALQDARDSGVIDDFDVSEEETTNRD